MSSGFPLTRLSCTTSIIISSMTLVCGNDGGWVNYAPPAWGCCCSFHSLFCSMALKFFKKSLRLFSVLMKLNKPANIAPNSRVKKICLPFADIKVNMLVNDPRPELDRSKSKTSAGQLFFYDYLGRPPDKGSGSSTVEDGGNIKDDGGIESSFPEPLPEREDNYLRRLRLLGELPRRPRTARVVVSTLIREHLLNRGNSTRPRSIPKSNRRGRRLYQTTDFNDDNGNDDDDEDDEHHRGTRHGGKRRRNDKFTQGAFYRNENYRNEYGGEQEDNRAGNSAMPDTSQYVDCLATGWGKSTIDDELTDILLQTKAPIQSSKKYCILFPMLLFSSLAFNWNRMSSIQHAFSPIAIVFFWIHTVQYNMFILFYLPFFSVMYIHLDAKRRTEISSNCIEAIFAPETWMGLVALAW